MKRSRHILLLWVMSLASFVCFLNGPDIVTSHEARVALPAREMWASGWPWSATSVLVPPVKLRPGVVRLAPDWDAPPIAVNPWLVPVMNGQIRLQKPPLPYWCAAVCFHLFGGFSEFAVRLVPALMGMIATLLVYDLGKLLYGRKAGFLTALVWVSTYSISDQYRKAMADPYLAFFTLGCVWAWVRAAKAQLPNSIRAVTLLLCFYVSLALALLAKGPIALLDILLPVTAFHLCFRRRSPGLLWQHLAGMILLLGIALPWALYVWKNVPYAMELWRYESVGELSDNTENARPWWFYLPQLLFLPLPWIMLGGAAVATQLFRARAIFLAWLRRRLLGEHVVSSTYPVGSALRTEISATEESVRTADPTRNTYDPLNLESAFPQETGTLSRSRYTSFFPLLWYLAAVIFFSFIHLKKNQYLLPALPAQALLIAQGMFTILAGVRRSQFKRLASAFPLIQTLIGIGFGIGLLVLVLKDKEARLPHGFFALLALGSAFLPLGMLVTRREKAWPLLQASAYILLILAFSRLYLTPQEARRSAKGLATELVELSTESGRALLISRLPEEVAVYLPADLHTNEFAHHVLVVVDDGRNVKYRERHHLPEVPMPHADQFEGWVPGASIVGIVRVPLIHAPGDARWKVYELIVSRTGYATYLPWSGTTQ